MSRKKNLLLKIEGLEFGDKLKCMSDDYSLVEKGEIVTFTSRAPLTLIRFQMKEHAGYYELRDFKLTDRRLIKRLK